MRVWIAAFVGIAYFTVGAALLHALLVESIFEGNPWIMAVTAAFLIGLTYLVTAAERARR